MTLYTLAVNKPLQVVWKDDPSTMIVNRDLINPVAYGGSNIAAANINALGVIDPLGSVTVDGSQDVYVLPVSGTPIVDVVPGAGGWIASPQQMAAQMLAGGQNVTGQLASLIATGTVSGAPGGVPLLRQTTQLGQAANQSLAAGATVTLLNNINIAQPGFESVFKLNLPSAAGTIPFAILSVGWQDAVTGLQVGFKQYALTAGNGAASALMFYLSGPVRGNQLVLTLQNLDPAQILTYSWLFNLTSHVYLVDRLLQPSYGATAPITFVNSNGNPAKGLLLAAAPSIGPNGATTRLCAASNAKCKLLVDDSGQLNNWAIAINDPATLYNASASNQIYKFNGVAGSTLVQEIQMPNGPVAVQFSNTQPTNTITLAATITVMEY